MNSVVAICVLLVLERCRLVSPEVTVCGLQGVIVH